MLDCVLEGTYFLTCMIYFIWVFIKRFHYHTLFELLKVFLGAPCLVSALLLAGWFAGGRAACSRQTHTVHYQGRTRKGVCQLLVGSAAVRCVPSSSCIARAAASPLVSTWYGKRWSYKVVICTERFFSTEKGRKCLQDIYEHAGIIESFMFCWLKHKLVLFVF
jgi:hypothetical protein